MEDESDRNAMVELDFVKSVVSMSVVIKEYKWQDNSDRFGSC
jgi:hypothetical protein